jgi:glycosyltransferase involved in cell wall biosynthesis
LVRATEILLIKNFFQRHNIDVVLAEFGMAGVEVLDVCIRAKIPLVVNFHGYDAFHADILNSYQHEYRRMFEIASSIIVGSYHMEKQLVALGAPQEKVVCHHLAVDVDEFKGGDPAESLPVFVAVGRFVDKKAPHLTILAFSEIAQQQPQARLIMVGTGVLFEACQQLIKALGLSEQIQLVGARPHHEVAELLRKARVFVQHSVTTHYGDSEGTVVSVLEACATGLPVVCTRHAGMNDTVLHGETGFLVDEGDIEGMAAHMLTLARDADLAGRMGRRAREHVAANFSMEQHIARLAEVLEGAAQRNPT